MMDALISLAAGLGAFLLLYTWNTQHHEIRERLERIATALERANELDAASNLDREEER
jgi:hypothetical protein